MRHVREVRTDNSYCSTKSEWMKCEFFITQALNWASKVNKNGWKAKVWIAETNTWMFTWDVNLSCIQTASPNNSSSYILQWLSPTLPLFRKCETINCLIWWTRVLLMTYQLSQGLSFSFLLTKDVQEQTILGIASHTETRLLWGKGKTFCVPNTQTPQH